MQRVFARGGGGDGGSLRRLLSSSPRYSRRCPSRDYHCLRPRLRRNNNAFVIAASLLPAPIGAHHHHVTRNSSSLASSSALASCRARYRASTTTTTTTTTTRATAPTAVLFSLFPNAASGAAPTGGRRLFFSGRRGVDDGQRPPEDEQGEDQEEQDPMRVSVFPWRLAHEPPRRTAPLPPPPFSLWTLFDPLKRNITRSFAKTVAVNAMGRGYFSRDFRSGGAAALGAVFQALTEASATALRSAIAAPPPAAPAASDASDGDSDEAALARALARLDDMLTPALHARLVRALLADLPGARQSVALSATVHDAILVASSLRFGDPVRPSERLRRAVDVSTEDLPGTRLWDVVPAPPPPPRVPVRLPPLPVQQQQQSAAYRARPAGTPAAAALAAAASRRRPTTTTTTTGDKDAAPRAAGDTAPDAEKEEDRGRKSRDVVYEWFNISWRLHRRDVLEAADRQALARLCFDAMELGLVISVDVNFLVDVRYECRRAPAASNNNSNNNNNNINNNNSSVGDLVEMEGGRRELLVRFESSHIRIEDSSEGRAREAGVTWRVADIDSLVESEGVLEYERRREAARRRKEREEAEEEED